VLLRGWRGWHVTFANGVGVASMVFGIAWACSTFKLSGLQLHEHYVAVYAAVWDRCCVFVVSYARRHDWPRVASSDRYGICLTILLLTLLLNSVEPQL